MSAVAYVILL